MSYKTGKPGQFKRHGIKNEADAQLFWIPESISIWKVKRVHSWRSHDPFLIAMSVSVIISENLLARKAGGWEETSKNILGIT